MKHLRLITIIFIALILTTTTMVASGCTRETTAPPQIIKDITDQEAFNLIQENKNRSDFVIVDVRTPGEFAEGHIAGAINIDYNSGTFRDDINKLDKAKQYLVYCRSGNRSRGAVETMKELKFQKVYHLYTGITGWTNSGYPTTK